MHGTPRSSGAASQPHPASLRHEVVVAPTIGWTRTITTLGTLTDADATLPRLKALVKVIDPWLDREIGALVDWPAPSATPP